MKKKKKLILTNHLCPGDLVMLTAAVRDLHKAYPGEYLTDVRTPCPALWEHNPYITAIADDDPEAQTIHCHYPSINRSNQEPWHFIHGFHRYLSDQLGRTFHPLEFRGHIPLADQEKHWISQVREIVQRDIPFWIIVAGGKFDYTIKWWSSPRYQAVVNHFKDRLQFVQIGSSNEHHHPPLQNVIDLRGKTDLRQLVRLMYHANGVLCPVTFAMHLSAAVEMKQPFYPTRTRPCVVVAGGREPAHWEAYPGHQFLHTVGALPCCDTGGCWKARVAPLGDGDEKDQPKNLCVDVAKSGLPHCMDMITPKMVIAAIENYIEGGGSLELSKDDLEAIQKVDIGPRDVANSGKQTKPTPLPLKGRSDAGQDEWILNEIFPGKRDGYFVELGAADGVTRSNTVRLEVEQGWNGICIEPNPVYFEKLVRNRGCHCVQQCVDGDPGPVDFVLAGEIGGIIADDTDNSRAVRGARLDQWNEDGRVRLFNAVPLDHVLDSVGAPQTIEYLSLDVEGAETRILKTFPFDRYRFLAMTIERPQKGLIALLETKGYSLVRQSGQDGFFLHKTLKP